VKSFLRWLGLAGEPSRLSPELRDRYRQRAEDLSMAIASVEKDPEMDASIVAVAEMIDRLREMQKEYEDLSKYN
jgi:truncated hemoglobin YjbI